ncbi:MAG TPA: hypothetical protein PK668_17475 [Myxococcota bacterium]|nr:hypothetical protein [Myxococcota bacterium]HRY94952.1 hypothetical protein [Myxococcota bacterium]HSA19985.1 hypothetical protein [Myxococcota bacterium]
MTRFRLLAVLPFLYLVPFVALERWLAGGESYGLFLRVEIELVKLIGLAGGLVAAWSFSRGEYLRRAWLWTAACSGLLLVADAALLLSSAGAPIALVGPLRGGLVLAANTFQAIGLYMLANAWARAGLELPGPRWTRPAAYAVACALALAVAAPALVVEGRGLLAGDWESAVGTASSLGDAVCLTLLAPLLLSYLAFRGGRIGWVWLLLVASGLAWLVWDGVVAYGPALGLPGDMVDLVSESCRALGCWLTLSAGLAQRWAVQG